MSTGLALSVWAGCGLAAGTLMGLAVRRQEQASPWAQLLSQIAVTGAIFVALAWRHNGAMDDWAAAGYASAAVPLAGLDLRTGRLPNWLMLLAYVLTAAGLLVATLVHPRAGGLLATLAGATVFAALYGVWYVFLPGQMGGGDLKLSVVSGAVLGWQGWPAAASPHFLTAGLELLAWLAGALLLIWLLQAMAYLVARAVKGRPATSVLRHGPFLVLGTVTATLLVP